MSSFSVDSPFCTTPDSPLDVGVTAFCENDFDVDKTLKDLKKRIEKLEEMFQRIYNVDTSVKDFKSITCLYERLTSLENGSVEQIKYNRAVQARIERECKKWTDGRVVCLDEKITDLSKNIDELSKKLSESCCNYEIVCRLNQQDEAITYLKRANRICKTALFLFASITTAYLVYKSFNSR